MKEIVMALPHLSGIARLTADPQLWFAPSGAAVCSLQLVFNSRRQDPSGAWVDGDCLFLKATAFRDLAEHCAETLTKGVEVVVAGRVKTEQWVSGQGEKRSAAALLLDAVGPSLRSATATLTKATRSQPGDPVGEEAPF